MPQRISKDRLLKLKRALLLATPSERLSDAYHEVYLRNGIRISIYSGDVVKPNQDVIVFRKYVMQKLCFEALSERKTFPKESIRIFELMRKVGFNDDIHRTGEMLARRHYCRCGREEKIQILRD